MDESKPGAAENKVSETGKLVGLLEDLSRRLKTLETATATMAAKERRNARRAQTSENRARKAQCAPTVQAKSFTPTDQKVNSQVCLQTLSNLTVLTFRRRRYSQTPLNRPTQSMHKFATITRLLVIRCVCAVNLVRTLKR